MAAALRVGLGQGLSDFNSLYQSGTQAGGDQFTHAWDDIQKQLGSEGAGTDAVNDAKAAFADSFNQFSQSVAGSAASDIGAAINGAKQYVLNGKTIAGAIGNVQNLVRDIQDGAPPLVTCNAFVGTLVGIAVAAGAFSAGVGAAIVTAVALIVDVISQFFSNGQPGAGICGSTFSPPPTWVVGCVGATGNIINTSNDNDWRRFPNPTNPADSGWFCQGSGQQQPYSGCGITVSWPLSNSVTWSPAGIGATYRLIDQAFPQYHHLECEHAQAQAAASVQIPQGATQVNVQVGPFQMTVTPESQAFANFQKAFFTAWQANQEYILNGLKPQPDWQVLLHAARIWNAAHEKGNGYSLAVQGGSSQAYIPAWPAYVTSSAQYSDPGGNCTGNYPGGFSGQGTPGPTFYPYEALLLNDVITNYGSNDPAGSANPLMVNNALQINTGPLKNTSGFHLQPGTIHLMNPGLYHGAGALQLVNAAGPTKPGAAAAAGMSTGAKWAWGLGLLGAVSVGGLYLYARKHHTTMGQVVKGVFHRHPQLAPSRRMHREGLLENPTPQQLPLRWPRKPRSEPLRRVAFRVQLGVSPLYQIVILQPDYTAILYDMRVPIVRFRPAKYQFGKIRDGKGDLLIYADQIVETLVSR